MTLALSVGGQPAALVLGGKGGGSWAGATGATTWRDRAWAQLRGAMTADVSCTGAIVRNVDTGAVEVYELGAPPSPTGALTGTTVLMAAATLVKWSTAQGGRSGKGRSFLPGLPASGVTGGGRLINTGHATTAQACVNAYLADTALASAGLQPAVLSFRTGAAHVITAGSVASVVGIQRRRMR